MHYSIVLVFAAVLQTILLQPGIAQTTTQCTAANEQFYPCGWCTRTCARLTVVCPLICRLDGGCGCINGYARDTTNGGVCVSATSAACVAQRVATTTAQPTVCSAANEQFYSCGWCARTCANPDVMCIALCRVPGDCGCISGYVRSAADGNACVNETSAACVAQRVATP